VFRTFVLLESIIWKNICIYIDNHPFVKIYDLTEVLETCCTVDIDEISNNISNHEIYKKFVRKFEHIIHIQ